MGLGRILSLFLIIALFLPGMVWAEESCTDQSIFQEVTGGADGILQQVLNDLHEVLNDSASKIFNAIVATGAYKAAFLSAAALSMAFYAIVLMMGITRLSPFELMMRLIKVGLVLALLSPSGWNFFFDNAGKLFDTGTSCMVEIVSNSASSTPVDGCPAVSGFTMPPPFATMDELINKMFSPRMLIIMWGTLTTKPYGIALFLAFGWSMLQMVIMILRAAQIFAMSMIIRTLLFALAPVFFAFLLFEQTKRYFTGWINMLVNFSVQPILLFAMLAFMVGLLNDTVDNAINIQGGKKVELCMVKTEKMGLVFFDVKKWRFKVDGQIFEGEWNFDGVDTTNLPEIKDKENFPIFPVDPLSIFALLFVTYLALKMEEFALIIASEISNTSLRLGEYIGNKHFGSEGAHGKETPKKKKGK